MTDAFLEELAAAQRSRTPCALITMAATRGSVPRAAGSKMLVYADGRVSGTIGGGKFESLVIEDSRNQMREKRPLLKTYPLHECSPESFGAICGGEATVLIEPQVLREAIFLIGAGHCSLAIAKLALDCGIFVTVVDDRAESLSLFPPQVLAVRNGNPANFIATHEWKADEALVIVSRNHEIDRDALGAALEIKGAGYIGMIGSDRKVEHVFAQMRERGATEEKLATIYAPIGFDIGADSPPEIAVSVIAEILSVVRGRGGESLRRKR